MRGLTSTGSDFSHDRLDSHRVEASRFFRNFLTAGTALVGLSLAGASTPAFAAAITWDGGGGNFNWGTAANWSGNVLPGAADDVSVDGGLAAGTPVVLNVTANIKTLVIDSGDSLSMDNGKNLTINGGGASVANNGAWSMNASTSNTILTFQGSSTLGGVGTLSLSDDAQNFINSNSGANVITQASGHTIQGSGALLNNQAGMVNEGKILATGALAALVIDPSAAGFDNKGTLQAQGAAGIDLTDGANTKNSTGNVEVGAGSRIDVTGNYRQTGGSTVVESAGLLTATGTVNIEGGRLGGNGTVDANVKNTGGVTGAGMSVGLLTIDGAYTQSLLGAFEVEIDSLTSFDFVDVLGAASLDGFLDVIIKQSIAYTLSVGSIFEVLNASSITGDFASLTDNIAGLTLERFVDAGSGGGQSVYLRVTENTVQPPVTDVPEPESALLFGAGLASIAALRRKLWRLLAG